MLAKCKRGMKNQGVSVFSYLKRGKGSANAHFVSFSVWGSTYAPVIYYPVRAATVESGS
jgi:hypothetical protein